MTKISFVIFDIVVKKKFKQIECGLAWHWRNSTDLALIDIFLTNLNTEIVACILLLKRLRITLRQTANGKKEPFAIRFQLSVQ